MEGSIEGSMEGSIEGLMEGVCAHHYTIPATYVQAHVHAFAWTCVQKVARILVQTCTQGDMCDGMRVNMCVGICGCIRAG